MISNYIPKSFRSWYLSKNVKLPHDMTKFVIIASARTGSNLLCGMLASHPDILCFYELFHPKAIFTGLDEGTTYLPESLERRDRYPGSFLESVYNSDYQKKAVGFKIFPRHNDVVLDYLLKNAEIKKIILKRRRLLHQYTSELIAVINRPLQKPGSDGSENVARAVTVSVKEEKFCRFADNTNKFYGGVEQQLANQDYFPLEYSELIGNERDAIRNLSVFLGVDMNVNLHKFHKKENPRELQSRIVNYESLKEDLVGTPYEQYFRNEF